MGTEIQVKSNLLGHYSMRDLNENSNICSWPPYPGDNMLPNNHYYNGYLPRAGAEIYLGFGKDAVKQKILEHEETFKKQLQELHRLYTKQRELMNEIKRKEILKGRMPVETSLASSPLASQITCDDVAKWCSPSVPMGNSSCLRPFASGAEGIQSPASSVRVNSMQAADVPSPSGFGFKSSEVLESTRPSKVRRKMFDLQLPADQYIDGDEQVLVKDDKLPGILTTPHKGDANVEFRNGVNILTGDGWRTDKKGLILGPRLYSGSGSVADLNKPFEVDEASGSAYVDMQGHGATQSSNLGSSNASFSHSTIGNNGRGWLSILEAGDSKGKKSVSQGIQPQKLHVITQPIQGLVNKVHEHVETEQSQLGQIREKGVCCLDASEVTNCPESVMSSHLPLNYQFSSSSDVAKSWSKSVSNIETQGSCNVNQKMPFQINPCLETTSSSYVKGLQLGAHQQGISGEMWQFRSDLPYQNGFSHGSSSSGPKEPPSQLRILGYDHFNSPTDCVASKELIYHGNNRHHPYSSSAGTSAETQVDLNVALSNGPSSSAVLKEKRMEDHPKIPPWLRSGMGSGNEAAVRADLNSRESSFIQSSANYGLTGNNEAAKGVEGNQKLSQSIASVCCSNDVEANRNGRGQCPSNRRILGFHIVGKSSSLQTDSYSHNSPSVPLSCPLDGKASEYDRKTRLLDINLPCDSVSELAKPSPAGSLFIDKGNEVKIRHHIDLNSIVSDDEASAVPSIPSKTGKRIPEIDLEAPAVLDEEFVCDPEIVEEDGEKSCRSIDEVMKFAAEAIVAISSSTVHDGYSLDKIYSLAVSLEDPLNWFADVAVSCFNDTENKSIAALSRCRRSGRHDGESTTEEIDDFESMTLQLTETKSEDYLPKPFIPDIPKEDESVVNPLSSRPRRGLARRGRQRRDFQRDILPGLASLSRHEVTEDLQTFGGLMRATGHAWQSGLTRRNSRNGCARGRRRTSNAATIASQTTPTTYTPPPLVQHLSAIDVALEDRSLTSWGKTTRRPRRQRCPAGNPPSIPVVQS